MPGDSNQSTLENGVIITLQVRGVQQILFGAWGEGLRSFDPDGSIPELGGQPNGRNPDLHLSGTPREET